MLSLRGAHRALLLEVERFIIAGQSHVEPVPVPMSMVSEDSMARNTILLIFVVRNTKQRMVMTSDDIK